MSPGPITTASRPGSAKNPDPVPKSTFVVCVLPDGARTTVPAADPVHERWDITQNIIGGGHHKVDQHRIAVAADGRETHKAIQTFGAVRHGWPAVAQTATCPDGVTPPITLSRVNGDIAACAV